jgi:lysine 2,3-aminomutase
VDPDAVTDELVGVLKTIQPIFVNAHFNHPREVNAKSIAALSRLIDAGIPVGSHTVILAGVNDDDSILEDLFVKLIQARVRPYHIYIADACQGTSHFRTSVARGLEIMDKLRLRCSGMMLPKLMMEGPEGEGKVPVESHVVSTGPELVYRSLHGDLLRYPDGGAGDDRATSRNVPQSRGVVSQKPKGSPLAT